MAKKQERVTSLKDLEQLLPEDARQASAKKAADEQFEKESKYVIHLFIDVFRILL